VLPTAVQSSPLVSIGDNVDVFFNGSSSLRWTSNVFRDEDQEVDDIIWTVTPGFDINVGRGLSNADFSIITRYDIIRYQDLDQLDTELFHIKAVGSYRTSRLDLNGSVSFDEAKASTGERNIQDLVESDTTRARIDGEYRFSPKLSVGSGYSYSKTEYKTYQEFFADRETSTIPVDLFYELTPKIDLSVGYAYTNTDVSETNTPLGGPFSSFRSDYETDSHFFNVGARGNLLSKVTGFFKVGYRVRDSDDSVVQILNSGAPFGLPTSTSRDSTGMLGLDLDLTWAATPKITARLDMSRDFGVGSEGATTENSTVNGSVSYSINSNWSAQGSAGYTLRDYDDDREDDQYRVGASLSFVPNQYWRFSAGYDFENNDSNEDDRSYENHNLFLSASLRY
jgi:hypothetical protein